MPRHSSALQHCENASNSDGFIALFSILIIGAFGLLVAVGLASQSFDEAKITIAREGASRARFLAHACAEEALKELKENKNYAGGSALVFPAGSCDILPVIAAGKNRTVRTQSAVAEYVKKVEVKVRVNGGLKVISWLDVADF